MPNYYINQVMWRGLVVAGLALIQLFVSNRFRQKTIKENMIMSRFKNILVRIETEEEASRMIDFLQSQGLKKLQEYHRKHRYIATNEEGFFFYEDFENDYNHDPKWVLFYSFKEFDEIHLK